MPIDPDRVDCSDLHMAHGCADTDWVYCSDLDRICRVHLDYTGFRSDLDRTIYRVHLDCMGSRSDLDRIYRVHLDCMGS